MTSWKYQAENENLFHLYNNLYFSRSACKRSQDIILGSRCQLASQQSKFRRTAKHTFTSMFQTFQKQLRMETIVRLLCWASSPTVTVSWMKIRSNVALTLQKQTWLRPQPTRGSFRKHVFTCQLFAQLEWMNCAYSMQWRKIQSKTHKCRTSKQP